MVDTNGTSFNFSSFTSVLAGGGALAGIGGVVVVVVAVVYALCCRRGRVSFTRAGLTIEPSPPRSGSAEPSIPSIELPSHLGGSPPPITPIPKRPARSSKTKAAEARVAQDSSEVAVEGSTSR